jgi:uncharacterized protein (DUF952 family)
LEIEGGRKEEPVDWIVHICQRTAWEAAQERGEYQALSLETEGFIHCSRPEQVLGVANAFYRRTPDLVLLWIDPQRVSAEVRWEPADGQVFPHIYGSLNTAAVLAARDLTPDEDGFFRQLPQV